MDLHHGRQKPSSHSSLYGAYNSQGLLNNTVQGVPRSHRPPLKPVSENSTFLRSPGLLESMLKTTTETGDIGLFTINPAVPPATYHQPPRTRPGLADVNLLQASRSRFYDNNCYSDDRKFIPSSYRDTTSEILSLYSSDTHHSRAFTPSNDDGQRSYSLTTCSSRHLPSQKSSWALQCQSSGPGPQRPRSPFPYPARLKRPDIRPASPALTKNGGVDYSRMVELDRAPRQRIIHRPTYTNGPQRASNSSLQADVNRSTTSLPCRIPPLPYASSPVPYRAGTPNSFHSKTPQVFDRASRGSSDQGPRSPSVASIVEMYQRPATSNANVRPLRLPASFYYDYSEEFENDPQPLNAPERPFCPVPKRAASISRPMVLRAEKHRSLDGPETGKILRTFGNCASKLEDKQYMSPQDHEFSPDDDGESQRPTRQFQATKITEPNLEEVRGNSPKTHQADLRGKGHHVGSDVNQGVQAPSERPKSSNSCELRSRPEERNATSFCENDNVNSSPQNTTFQSCGKRSKTLGAYIGRGRAWSHKRSSRSSLKGLRCTLDPALSEFASLLTSFDRLAKPVVPRKTAIEPKAETKILTEDSEFDFNGLSKGGALVTRKPCLDVSKRVQEENKPFRKGHRRNFAATRINTSDISKPLDPRVQPPGSSEDAVIVSPEPISPACQLRVKNSIPQLMKALPPLPTECLESSDRTSTGVFEANDFDDGVNPGAPPTEDDNCGPDADHLTEEKHNSPPKLKLRLKQSPTTASGANEESFESQEVGKTSLGEGNDSPARRKFKIKVSRNQPPLAHAGRDGTVLRSPVLKQCNSLADLEHCARKDMFSSQCHLEDVFFEQNSESGIEANCPAGTGGSREVSKPSPQPSYQFDIQYPHFPNKGGLAIQTDLTCNEKTLRHSRSLDSGFERGYNRQLRRKLSFLKIRMAGKQKQSRTNGTVYLSSMQARVSSPKTPTGNGGYLFKLDELAELQSAKIEGRVRRWARGAKNAVRSCVRRTFDRSTGSHE